MPYQLATWSFQYCCHLERVDFSSRRWASIIRLRSSGLKAYTSFDADDRVAYVRIAADGIAGTNLLDLLDSLDLVVEVLTVDSDNLAFLELYLQQ